MHALWRSLNASCKQYVMMNEALHLVMLIHVCGQIALLKGKWCCVQEALCPLLAAADASQMTAMMEQMLRDPNMQKMLYPYLPEAMRNPDSIEWMLNNPEVRKQMEGVFASSVRDGRAFEACDSGLWPAESTLR